MARAITPTLEELAAGIELGLNQGNTIVVERSLNESFSFAGSAFANDSNFPTPSLTQRLRLARDLIVGAGVPLGVFGHADPAGGDSYNKRLSDSRAQIVLALAIGDFDLFEQQAKAHNAWGLREYQAMLRALGPNPGPIDGDSGALTQAAVRSFQDEYNRRVYHALREREFADLKVDGVLGDKTKAAIRDAYHSMHTLGLAREQFVGPAASGCSEFAAVFPRAGDNRRVQLVLYTQDVPDASEFPCKQGEVGACQVDRSSGNRCRFNRRVAAGKTRALPGDGAFSDSQWLRNDQQTSFVSAITLAPDNAPITFTLHRADKAAFARSPSSGPLGTEPKLGPALATAQGKVALGVCYASLRHPPGFDPYDIFTWYEDIDASTDSIQDGDEDAPDGAASIQNILDADTFKPPVFLVRSDTHWGLSTPPGTRLNRVEIKELEPTSGVALTSRGELVGFAPRQGPQDADDSVEVHSVMLAKLDVTEEEQATG